MKSIRTKILLVVCLLVTVSLAVVGITVSVLMYSSSMDSLEKTMTETARVSSRLIYEYLETYKAVASEAGLMARLSNPDLSVKEKTNVIDDKIKQYGFLNGNIADLEGKGVLYEVDISERDYFKAALQGKSSVSNVLLSKSLGRYVIIVAAPLRDGGKSGGSVVGVVYFNVDVTGLADIVSEIEIGKTGGAYMIDADNYTIAHKNVQQVLDRENTAEDAKTDPKLAQLAQMEKKMTNGETGFGVYEYNGVKKLLAYTPVDTGQGWSIAINAELSEFLASTFVAIMITAILVAAATIIGIIVSVRLAISITKPITKIENVAKEMAKGNYDVELTYESRDEIGSLASSMRQMMTTTKEIIKDTGRGLSEIASGNFSVEPKVNYIGVFEGIHTPMQKIIVDLSETMSQIKMSADQVSSGSEQVSSGAQALAQGATEQASAVQELSASINEVSAQIGQNAHNAGEASTLAERASDGITLSNQQMQEMMGAMSEISESSSQISKIIKTIEDIAFQTNILALNAAVEAARAGAAGKGFAVVADEVRNLSTKSSEAAKQTNVLIEGSVRSVEHGVKIAGETAKSLTEVVAGAQELTKLIEQISEASASQSAMIAQINLGVEQISSVVQTNSATSEQSAAASEELNGQAGIMKEMVGKFKLQQSKENIYV